ncbi:MAG: tetratricopeptide repeat protein, partial [Phycisphaerae bacterium]|nr:tetratricopeptide repeat protein [Phycisphaerae bacterium]
MAALLLACAAAGGCPHPPDAHAPDPPTPAAVDASLRAAQTYLDGNEGPKAKAILARLLDRTPNDARAHELMARVLTGEAVALDAVDADAAHRARRDAYAHYDRAATLDPHPAGLHQNAAILASMLREHGDAARHYEAAARLDPTNPQPPLYAAQTYLQLGDTAAARDAIARVLVIDPDEPLAHATLAMVALGEERFDAALEHVREARGLAPADVRFRTQEAKILRHRGEPHAALQ